MEARSGNAPGVMRRGRHQALHHAEENFVRVVEAMHQGARTCELAEDMCEGKMIRHCRPGVVDCGLQEGEVGGGDSTEGGSESRGGSDARVGRARRGCGGREGSGYRKDVPNWRKGVMGQMGQR